MPVKFVEEKKVIYSTTACFRTNVYTSEVMLSEYKISNSVGWITGRRVRKRNVLCAVGQSCSTVGVWLC